MNVTSEIPGDPSSVTDSWDVACPNLGIVPGAGEQNQGSHSHGKDTRLFNYELVLPIYIYFSLSLRCRSSPNPARAVLSFELLKVTNSVNLWCCFLSSPSRYPLFTLRMSSIFPFTYPVSHILGHLLNVSVRGHCDQLLPLKLTACTSPSIPNLACLVDFLAAEHTDTSPGQQFEVNFCLFPRLALLSQLSCRWICSTRASQEPSVNKTLAPGVQWGDLTM